MQDKNQFNQLPQTDKLIVISDSQPSNNVESSNLTNTNESHSHSVSEERVQGELNSLSSTNPEIEKQHLKKPLPFLPPLIPKNQPKNDSNSLPNSVDQSSVNKPESEEKGNQQNQSNQMEIDQEEKKSKDNNLPNENMQSNVSLQVNDQSNNENQIQINKEEIPAKKVIIPFMTIDQFLPESQPSVKNFICSYCLGVLHVPVLYQNQLYCKDCLKETGEEKLKEAIPQNDTASAIEKETLCCSNRCLGCAWIGSPKDFEMHLSKSCMKQIINCLNTGCTERVPREELFSHIQKCPFRITRCMFCNEKVCAKFMSEHYNNCTDYEIPCIQNCGCNVKRGDMNNHIENNCPNTKVPCEYEMYGCKHTPVKRQFFKDTMRNLTSEHLKVVTKYIKGKESEFNSFKLETGQKMNLMQESFDKAKIESDKEINHKISANSAKEIEISLDVKKLRDDIDIRLTTICQKIGLSPNLLGIKRSSEVPEELIRLDKLSSENSDHNKSKKSNKNEKQSINDVINCDLNFYENIVNEEDSNYDINRKVKKSPYNKKRK